MASCSRSYNDLNKVFVRHSVFARNEDVTMLYPSRELDRDSLTVSPRDLIRLGLYSNRKVAYIMLRREVEKGCAEKIGYGKYRLYSCSSLYKRVKKALERERGRVRHVCSGGVCLVGGWRFRWFLVWFEALLAGGVRPGWVARVFGLSRGAAWSLLYRMERAGLLRRVGGGWWVAVWVVGVTRVDCGGVVVSNRSVLGYGEHHPVLGWGLFGEVGKVVVERGGSVQLAFAREGRWLSNKFVACYRYRSGGKVFTKVEPVIRVSGPNIREAVLSGLKSIRELYEFIRPLALIAEQDNLAPQILASVT